MFIQYIHKIREREKEKEKEINQNFYQEQGDNR